MYHNYNRTYAIMKGLAITSVVIGHCQPSPGVGMWVNQYHLAVFFFVAGYFFKESYLETPGRYVLKRIQRLYVPFVEFGLVFLLLHNLLTSLHIYENVLTTAEILRGG